MQTYFDFVLGKELLVKIDKLENNPKIDNLYLLLANRTPDQLNLLSSDPIRLVAASLQKFASIPITPFIKHDPNDKLLSEIEGFLVKHRLNPELSKKLLDELRILVKPRKSTIVLSGASRA